MGWELEADIDLMEPAGAPSLARAFVTVLGDLFGPDLVAVQLSATRGGWRGEEFARATVAGGDDAAAAVERHVASHLRDDVRVSLEAELRMSDGWAYRPRPALSLFGPREPGVSPIRRRCDAVLGLGNHIAWEAGARLASGLRTDEELLAKLLEAVCRVARPASLYLLPEEGTSFPINYHFVFHRDPGGWARDLADVVRIALHGGAGYDDGRRAYEPAVTDRDGETMLFGGREGEYRAAVRDLLAAKGARAEARGLPATLDRPTVEDAILSSDVLTFFECDGGLGVHGTPLLGTYCEDVYVALLERLAPPEPAAAGGEPVERTTSPQVLVSDDGGRCFVIPADRTLAPGPLALFDLEGGRRDVDPSAVAAFEVAEPELRRRAEAVSGLRRLLAWRDDRGAPDPNAGEAVEALGRELARHVASVGEGAAPAADSQSTAATARAEIERALEGRPILPTVSFARPPGKRKG